MLANGKLGIKHTRNVAEIAESVKEAGESKTTEVSATPTYRANVGGSATYTTSPKGSFISVLTTASPRIQTADTTS